MFPSASPAQLAPPTSQWALEILDELRIALLECVLVLEVLPEEAGLHFGGLAEELDAAHRGAREAHHAASLLREGAELDTYRDERCRRHPHTLLSEHLAAVRQGAVVVAPAESLAEHVERRVWGAAAGGPGADRELRPRCTARIGQDSRWCSAEVLYRDAESFGVHCYRHATDSERHHDLVTEAQLYEHELELMSGYKRAFGREVAAVWIQQRRKLPRWFDRTRTTAAGTAVQG